MVWVSCKYGCKCHWNLGANFCEHCMTLLRACKRNVHFAPHKPDIFGVVPWNPCLMTCMTTCSQTRVDLLHPLYVAVQLHPIHKSGLSFFFPGIFLTSFITVYAIVFSVLTFFSVITFISLSATRHYGHYKTPWIMMFHVTLTYSDIQSVGLLCILESRHPLWAIACYTLSISVLRDQHEVLLSQHVLRLPGSWHEDPGVWRA